MHKTLLHTLGYLGGGVFLLAIIGIGFFGKGYYEKYLYREAGNDAAPETISEEIALDTHTEVHIQEIETIQKVTTPSPVRAVYMTSWVAGMPSLRRPIIEMIEKTELNAIVLDIKDDTGKIAFHVHDPVLRAYGSAENRIRDIDELLLELREKNIYVIGRISVFQDPFLATSRPDLAILSTNGSVWKDRKGLSFLDPQKEEVRDYVVRLAKESHMRGFDEINFDYIRFPSDGVIRDIVYGLDPGQSRVDVLEEFFAALQRDLSETGMVTSADLFGMTTTNSDDLGIGQVWEQAVPYFDYIAPMVYPSHYPPTWRGFANPAEHPYHVIYAAIQGAIQKTVDAGYDQSKIRPWIQDFNLGSVYTPEMVRAQMNALYDLGIDSWMVWNPSNRYRSHIFLDL